MFSSLYCRYYSERGDAVAKASKQPHVVSQLSFIHLLHSYGSQGFFVFVYVMSAFNFLSQSQKKQNLYFDK